MEKTTLLQQLAGGLIVSVQPDANHPELDPMNNAVVMAALAQSVLQGGAAGLRVNSPAHVRAVRAVAAVPLIGLYKYDLPGYAVRITPTLAHALEIASAGADIIALDATFRPHPEGFSAAELIAQVKAETNCLVMADIATLAEGMAAAEAGADFVATTLSGYTDDSPRQNGPDFSLAHSLAEMLDIPVVAEGRIGTPEEASRMLAGGAFAVTVGSAITRPRVITENFIRKMQSTQQSGRRP